MGFSSLRAGSVDRFLRDLCTSEAFELGVKYYEEGRVKILNFAGDGIRASVQGASTYHVDLGLPKNGREFMSYSCACANDYSGCCEHVVAVIIAASQSFAEGGRGRGRSRFVSGVRERPYRASEYEDDDEEEEEAAGGPLDAVSGELFVNHDSGGRRGRKTVQSLATALLKSLDQLEAAVGGAAGAPPLPGEGSAADEGAPGVDPALSEFVHEGAIREWIGPHNYLAGVSYYMEGRVSARRVWRNTLSAKVNVHRRGRLGVLRGGNSVEECSVWARVWNREARGDIVTVRIESQCDCVRGGEEEPCSHIAALLVAWLRKPAMFENVKISEPSWKGEASGEAARRSSRRSAEIGRATRGLLISLQRLLQMVEEQGCQRKEMLDVMETAYSRIKLASANLHERASEASKLDGEERRDQLEALLAFSLVLHTASTRLLACLERKFEAGVLTGLLADSSMQMAGRLLESLANSGAPAPAGEKAAAGSGRAEAGRDGPAEAQTRTGGSPDEVVALAPAPAGVQEGVGGGDSGKVSRSWDDLVEEFARG